MALLKNPKKVVYVIAVFLVVSITAWATKCHASDLHFGAGTTISRGQTEVIDLSLTFRNGAPLDAHWQGFLTIIGDSTYFDLPQPNQAALGMMLVDGFWHFDLGLGVVFLQNVDLYNGSHGNFCLQAGYRWKRLMLSYRHISNGGTRKPNVGRDFVVLSWEFR